jgi:tetratricopeptide (TPR) repeat protein
LDMRPEYEALNFHLGKVLDKMLRYDEAIPYLNKAVEKNPKNDGAFFNLALSYTNKGDNINGLKYFLKVIEIAPTRADAWNYAGQLYNATGNREKGREYLAKAAELGAMNTR